jgi:hypothetical protein
MVRPIVRIDFRKASSRYRLVAMPTSMCERNENRFRTSTVTAASFQKVIAHRSTVTRRDRHVANKNLFYSLHSALYRRNAPTLRQLLALMEIAVAPVDSLLLPRSRYGRVTFF